jgi:HEAT repeats
MNPHLCQNRKGGPAAKSYSAAAKPLLDQLAELGYRVESLSELRHRGKSWETALPILLSWLPNVDDLSVKEDIVRCLSVPWVGDRATAELINEFKRYAPILPKPSNPWVGNQLRKIPDEEMKLSPSFSLAWAIGNALSIVEVKDFEKQVIELCRNPRYGEARQMLVFGLGRLRSSEAEETAVELLNDEQVRVQAIAALGTMKSKRALFELERLLGDKEALIRKEARKAITKIMR